jgi:hypothetical protein
MRYVFLLGAGFAAVGLLVLWLLNAGGTSLPAETAPSLELAPTARPEQRLFVGSPAPDGRLEVGIINEEGPSYTCYFDATVTYEDGKVTSVAQVATDVRILAGEEVTGLRSGRENASRSEPVHFEDGRLVAGYGECVETNP